MIKNKVLSSRVAKMMITKHHNRNKEISEIHKRKADAELFGQTVSVLFYFFN